jgi:hypothetical protein
VSNATDSDERVKAGFAALLQELKGDSLPDPDDAKRANQRALEREQARARAEYIEQGLAMPSPLALSITARRELGLMPDQPSQEAAE